MNLREFKEVTVTQNHFIYNKIDVHAHPRQRNEQWPSMSYKSGWHFIVWTDVSWIKLMYIIQDDAGTKNNLPLGRRLTTNRLQPDVIMWLSSANKKWLLLPLPCKTFSMLSFSSSRLREREGPHSGEWLTSRIEGSGCLSGSVEQSRPSTHHHHSALQTAIREKWWSSSAFSGTVSQNSEPSMTNASYNFFVPSWFSLTPTQYSIF